MADATPAFWMTDNDDTDNDLDVMLKIMFR